MKNHFRFKLIVGIGKGFVIWNFQNDLSLISGSYMKNLSRGEAGIQSSTSSRKQTGEKRKNKKCRKDSGTKKKLKKIKRDLGNSEMITLNCILITFKISLRYLSCFYFIKYHVFPPFLSKNLRLYFSRMKYINRNYGGYHHSFKNRFFIKPLELHPWFSLTCDCNLWLLFKEGRVRFTTVTWKP